MRIFFICQRVPYPPDRGDKIITYNEVRHLCKRHEVHVFCLADGEQDLDNLEPLQSYVSSVTVFPMTPAETKLRALRALVFGGPLSVAGYYKKSLQQALDRAFAQAKPDLLFIFSSNMAEYAVNYTDTPRIMQFTDLDSLKWGQYAERSGWPIRWVYRLEQRRLLDYERRIASAFDHSLVCTDLEKKDFEQLIPGPPVSTVSNGVDLEYFRPLGTPKRPASLVFTGVMDYLPNIDAVEWFCRDILPLVRESVPEAEFVICGSRPAPAVLKLAKIPGVAVTGRVPDTRPFMDAATVFVAPLRMGRGVQNKVLEALAMGLPCVASLTAWRGTVIPQGAGIVVTDDPVAFARHTVKLLSDEPYRAQMASLARPTVEAHYSWSVQMQRLDQIIEQVVRQRRPAGT